MFTSLFKEYLVGDVLCYGVKSGLREQLETYEIL